MMESNENFRALVENANDGILVATGKGKHVYANKRASEITGYGIPEILEARIEELAHPAELKKIRKRLKRKAEGKSVPQRYETLITRKDGRNVAVEITESSTSWYDQPSDIIIIRDIEDQKRREEKLQESEEKHRILMNSIRDGIYILDREGRFTFVNDVIVRRSKHKREWFLGKSYLDIISPEDKNNVQKKFEATMRGEKVPVYEVAYYTALGHEIWVEVNTTPIRREKDVVAMIGISRDISDRKQAERRLKVVLEELEKRVDERTEDLREKERESEKKSIALEEINAALNILLKKRERDKTELEEKVLFNVKELVEPYLKKLKMYPLDPRQETCVGILESNIEEIISPFSHRLSTKYSNLTHKETQVADLIRHGKNTKEIGELLDSTVWTIQFHRKSLRRKLGLKNKKANLKSHLLTFS